MFLCRLWWERKPQEATKIVEEMHEAGVVPSLMTYNTLISGCVRAEAPNEALSVFNLMTEKRIRRDQVVRWPRQIYSPLCACVCVCLSLF